MVPLAANCNIAREHNFIVGQDSEGHWLAVETHGLGGGIFRDQDAAVHYALGETDRRPGAVVMAPTTILLVMTGRCAA